VLFVCYGNICRSPIAEALFRRLAAGRPALGGVDVASAGVAALEGGRATGLARAVASELLDLDLAGHRARQLDTSLAADAGDLVLAMDDETLRLAEACRFRARVELLGEYVGTGETVTDPYGGSWEEYAECARQIGRLVRALVDRLEAESLR
jgi:protein-tyrosine phosphatase